MVAPVTVTPPRAKVDEMWQRIRECAKKLASQDAFELFAAKAGIPESTFYRYANGHTAPPVRAVVAMANAADVNLLWLATGIGPRDCRSAEELFEFDRTSFEPVRDLGAPSQNGGADDLWGCIRMKPNSVDVRRTRPIRLGAIRFEETIANWRYHFGDTLLVDLSRTEARTGDWCLRLPTGEIVVRSLVVNSTGAIELSWPRENGAFEAKPLSREAFSASFQLIGAVVGHLRSSSLP